MSIYNLKSLDATRFMIAKFDEDFNVLSTYTLAPAERGTGYSCDCPANQRSVITKLCRHRRMLPIMMGAVNTDRFYNPETGVWCEPLGDMHRVEPEPELTAEEIEDMPDGAEKDHHHAMQEALFGPVEAPEGLVGEALGSSAEASSSLISPSSRELVESALPIYPRPAAPASPSAPTIRRR